MKKTVKHIIKHICVFFAVLLGLYILLPLSAMIPNDAIRNNMTKSAYYYKENIGFAFHNGDKWCSISDNYADSILLNLAYNMGKGNPFKSTLDTRYCGGENIGTPLGLYLALSDTSEPNVDYTRYWHGTAIFARLFHLFTNIGTLKIAGLVSALVFALATLVYLIRRRCYKTAAAFFISMICIHIWYIVLAVEYQSTFVIGFMMCFLFLKAEKANEKLLTYLAVISGTLVCFFDFLTCETVAILLPLALVIAARTEEGRLGSFKDSFILIVKNVACFLGAYAGAFIAKWTLASLVTGENKFISALNSVSERMGSDLAVIETDNIFESAFHAIMANLTVLFGGEARVELGRVVLGLVICAIVVFALLYLFRKKEINRCAIALLLLLGCIVYARYMMLSNHSYRHEFFTYRAQITPIFAVISSLLLSIELPKLKNTGKK